MKKFLLTAAILMLATASFANGGEVATTATPNSEKEILELISRNIVTQGGLYYEGKKGVNYQFGPQMTPHGDCFAYLDGYIFFGWWKGGLENRNLMLSRMKVGSNEWETIEFAETHDGYYDKDPTLGDSHNTIAVGISPIDKTIHLVYDIHSFFISYKTGYFKYKVSEKNAVTASKEEWNASLFCEERNYLNPGRTYERSTYPVFDVAADGNLMLKLRFGGTGRGNTTAMFYDGNEWGLDVVEFNSSRADDDNGYPIVGGKPIDERYSIYGDFQCLHGKYQFAFAIRTENTRFKNSNYKLNEGLYYASTDDPTMKSGWKTLSGESFELPVGMPDQLLIAEPCPVGGSMSTGPVWTVTESDAKHFITKADNVCKHYYTTPGGTELFEAEARNQPMSLLSCGDKIFAVSLDKGKLRIDCTQEGTNDWELIYKDDATTYMHARADMFDGKIFVFLMEKSSGNAQPIHSYVFEMK